MVDILLAMCVLVSVSLCGGGGGGGLELYKDDHTPELDRHRQGLKTTLVGNRLQKYTSTDSFLWLKNWSIDSKNTLVQARFYG